MIGWLLLGLLLLQREANMKLCQPGNRFQTDSVEEARTICQLGNELLWGNQARGDSPINVRLRPITCPGGGKPIGVWHSHPGGKAEPSLQDIAEMKRVGLPYMCISSDTEIACYKVER